MNERNMINELFAPIAWPADLPFKPPVSMKAQVPSDRLREKAREFAEVLVGLTQDPELHAIALPQIRDVVISCELAIAARVGLEHPTVKVARSEPQPNEPQKPPDAGEGASNDPPEGGVPPTVEKTSAEDAEHRMPQILPNDALVSSVSGSPLAETPVDPSEAPSDTPLVS